MTGSARDRLRTRRLRRTESIGALATGFGLLLVLALWAAEVQAQQLVVEFDVVGLNRNQAAADATLTNACESIAGVGTPSAAQSDLLNTCALRDALRDDLGQLADGLDPLVPEEAFVLSDSLTDARDVQVTAVRSRIRARRRADAVGTEEALGFGPSGLTGVFRSGGGASGEELVGSDLQLFVSGYVSDGEYDGRDLQQDTDISASNVSLGLDYRVAGGFVVGTAIGVLRNETDFRRSAGGLSAESIDVTLFGTYYRRDTSYLDLVLDIGSGSYELTRQINLAGSSVVLAEADTDATVVSVSGGFGKSFALRGWTLDPYLRGSFTFASVDSYSEAADSTLPGFGAALRVGSQSIRSGTVSLGGRVSRAIGTARAVVVPELSAELQFETQPDKDDIDASFLADPDSNRLRVEGEERDLSSATVGAGASAVFANGRSVYVYLDTRVQHDYLSQSWLKAGFRWEF